MQFTITVMLKTTFPHKELPVYATSRCGASKLTWAVTGNS